MKTFEEFQRAMETDASVVEAAKKVITETMTDSEKILALVKVAKELGYNVSVEDFSIDEAINGEISDKEVRLASGGGKGEEACCFNYFCSVVWNTCVCSNECKHGPNCTECLV